MATGLRLLGLALCIAMATGDHHMMSSLEDLAEIQRDLYLKTFEFFNASVNTEMEKMITQLRSLEARLDDVEGRLQDYAFKIPPAELASSCDAERALVRLNSSLVSWYERLTRRLAAVEELIQFIAISETSAARTGSNNEVPVNDNDEDLVPVELEPEPVAITTTTTKKPRRVRSTTTRAPTTRRTTTTRRPTTTLPPTTTTLPTTTTPPTTTPVPTTPMPTPVTCAELAQRGETQSGTYLIDPTRSGNSFYAECELPKGVTSIGHSVVGRDVSNNGNEEPASFRLNPMYDATIDQMKALTAASQNCSQFIKYRCRAAVLLAADKKSGLQYGYWVSVDGEQIVSWGGAPINSGKCACASTVEGCLGSKQCNCDSNPKSFAIDEGLITDKPYLPVTDVFLGDTGSKKEEGFITLGPLRCQ